MHYKSKRSHTSQATYNILFQGHLLSSVTHSREHHTYHALCFARVRISSLLVYQQIWSAKQYTLLLPLVVTGIERVSYLFSAVTRVLSFTQSKYACLLSTVYSDIVRLPCHQVNVCLRRTKDTRSEYYKRYKWCVIYDGQVMTLWRLSTVGNGIVQWLRVRFRMNGNVGNHKNRKSSSVTSNPANKDSPIRTENLRPF